MFVLLAWQQLLQHVFSSNVKALFKNTQETRKSVTLVKISFRKANINNLI